MKTKPLFLAIALLLTVNVYSQIGINTANPKGTLDVVGTPADPNVLDGVVLPRLTAAQLKAKAYTAAQTGAFVYVTSADPSPSGQTVNVVAPGTYFFTGTVWDRVITKSLPTAQLVLIVKATGSQSNVNAVGGAKLAYFSDSAVKGGQTLEINDAGSWDPTGQTYTAPISGLYQVVVTAAMGTCTGAADGAAGYIRTIKRSGTTNTVINTADLRYTNGLLTTNEFSTVNLNAGDKIFVDYNANGATYCSFTYSNIQGLNIYRYQ